MTQNLAVNEVLDVPIRSNMNGASAITDNFIREFKHRQNIARRTQSGHRSRNTKWTEYFDRLISHHLDVIRSKFLRDNIDENAVFHFYETHFSRKH